MAAVVMAEAAGWVAKGEAAEGLIKAPKLLHASSKNFQAGSPDWVSR